MKIEDQVSIEREEPLEGEGVASIEDLPPFEDMEPYLDEQVRELEAYFSKNSHTNDYIDLMKSIMIFEGSTKAIRSKFNKSAQELRELIDAEVSELDEETPYSPVIDHFEESLSLSESAYKLMSAQKISQDYASILNLLENYLIDVVMKIMIRHPLAAAAGKMEAKFSYAEVCEMLQYPEALRDAMLEKVIQSNEGDYKQTKCMLILEKYFKSKNHAVANISDMERHLRRAYEVRHKITHRNSKVDAMFKAKLESLRPAGAPNSEFNVIGNPGSIDDKYYVIRSEELRAVVKLVKSYTQILDKAICQIFPDLVDHDPFSADDELSYQQRILSSLA